jgi:hypothetical protein
MNLEQLNAELSRWIDEPTLLDEVNLAGREQALDLISLVQEAAGHNRRDPAWQALAQRAGRLQTQLVAMNQQMFAQLRLGLQQGEYSSSALRELLNRFTKYNGVRGQLHLGYNGLDLLLDGVFQPEPPPRATVALTAEMVHCEPTPAQVVLELVDYAGLTSESIFYDLGSGLGQVAILVNLLTGVRSNGVELDPVLCNYAHRCATALALPNVVFLHGDARTINYDDGTHFFLFTPFRGMILQMVLARLQTIARQRPLTICTYGPCTPMVAQQPWLRAKDDHGDHEYKLAIFTSDKQNGSAS